MLSSTLTGTTVEAIRACIKGAVPFVCFMRPEASEARFYADDSEQALVGEKLSVDNIDSFEGFLISTYGLGNVKSFYGIRPRLTAEDIISASYPEKLPTRPDTLSDDIGKADYLSAVAAIIGSLSGDDEKAVYARQLTLTSDVDPLLVTDRYFGKHPHCFRFLYYTPATGMWLGASPELLVKLDRSANKLWTMALAGTRAFGEKSEWTLKNKLEHNIVIDYIRDTLSSLGVNPAVADTYACRFGSVEHLCTPIEGTPAVPLSTLICHLSPTPALCGWPVRKAAQLISAHEPFTRHCYAGTVGECSAEESLIYVNLRSVEIIIGTPCQYRMIAGGGITVNSDPEEEWAETENKMKSLTDIISAYIVTNERI